MAESESPVRVVPGGRPPLITQKEAELIVWIWTTAVNPTVQGFGAVLGVALVCSFGLHGCIAR